MEQLQLSDVNGDDDGLLPFSQRFFLAWFVFCALLAVSMLLGGAYVVYLLLTHFGVM